MSRTGLKPRDPAERFMAFVMPEPNSGCWLWMGATNNRGYGVLGMGGKGRTVLAHRFAFSVSAGAIPAGLHVCHKCDTPACVNPDHLFVGTRSDNLQDSVTKGRHGSRTKPWSRRRGEDCHKSKLTFADVLAIRLALDRSENQKAIASRYGVTQAAISAIATRKSWAHV